jgi:hypothetical protein
MSGNAAWIVGLCLLLGVLLSWAVMSWYFRREPRSQDRTDDLRVLAKDAYRVLQRLDRALADRLINDVLGGQVNPASLEVALMYYEAVLPSLGRLGAEHRTIWAAVKELSWHAVHELHRKEVDTDRLDRTLLEAQKAVHVAMETALRIMVREDGLL